MNNVCKILLIVSLIFIITGCDNGLKSKFEDSYIQKITIEELLHEPELKKRIIEQCSKEYYEKIIEVAKIYSPIYFDSLNNCFHLYGWKNYKYDENLFRLRYYVNKDSVATNVFINNIEIDRSGDSDYRDWRNNYTEQPFVKSIISKAEQGKATAQTILGIYYIDGLGVEKDKDKGLYWITKAAKQNLGNAQYLLGTLLIQDNDTEKDISKAIPWIKKSAEQEHVQALTSLALLYLEGEKISKDSSKAIDLFEQAARQNTECQYILGNIYWDSKFIDSNKKLALQWYTTAAENNNINAQNVLGNIYLDEKSGITQDLHQALLWFTKSAEQGDSSAQYLLARIYMQDEINLVFSDYPSKETIKKMATKNLSEGLKWLTKSAEQGNLSAQRSLGDYYYREGNLEEARKWFRKAYEQGDDLFVIYPNL